MNDRSRCLLKANSISEAMSSSVDISSANDESQSNFVPPEFADVDQITILNPECQETAKLLENLPQISFSKSIENGEPHESFLSFNVVSSAGGELMKAGFQPPLRAIPEFPSIECERSLQINAEDIDFSGLADFRSSEVSSPPQQSLSTTIVEQPNVYPSSCFICGKIFKSHQEYLTYDKSQAFQEMNISFLQLLGDVVNQTVVTDTDTIELCLKCSDLMNEIDISMKRLSDLKKDINRRFSINTRPKITFYLSSKFPLNNNCSSSSSSEVVKKKSNESSLLELAISRPKRGRRKSIRRDPSATQIDGNKNSVDDVTKYESVSGSGGGQEPNRSNVTTTTKKSSGRPRKPFQCNVCRLKFPSKLSVEQHIKKSHNFAVGQNVKSKELINSNDASKSVPKVSTSNKAPQLGEGGGVVCLASDDDAVSHCLPPVLRRSSSKLSSSTSSSFATRLIQPKPETSLQTTTDGSIVLFVNPVEEHFSPSVIKISPEYFNLTKAQIKCDVCHKKFCTRKGLKVHQIATHDLSKEKSSLSSSSGGESTVTVENLVEDFLTTNYKNEISNLCGESTHHHADATTERRRDLSSKAERTHSDLLLLPTLSSSSRDKSETNAAIENAVVVCGGSERRRFHDERKSGDVKRDLLRAAEHDSSETESSPLSCIRLPTSSSLPEQLSGDGAISSSSHRHNHNQSLRKKNSSNPSLKNRGGGKTRCSRISHLCHFCGRSDFKLKKELCAHLKESHDVNNPRQSLSRCFSQTANCFRDGLNAKPVLGGSAIAAMVSLSSPSSSASASDQQAVIAVDGGVVTVGPPGEDPNNRIHSVLSAADYSSIDATFEDPPLGENEVIVGDSVPTNIWGVLEGENVGAPQHDILCCERLFSSQVQTVD